MEEIIKQIGELESLARETYRLFAIPLHTQSSKEAIETLNKVKKNLDSLSMKILDINRATAFKFVRELDPAKLNTFNQNIIIHGNQVQKHIFLEINKKEDVPESDLVNIKEAITKPQVLFDIELSIKNEINLFIDFLERAKIEIEHRYVNLEQKKKSIDELLKLLEQKDSKIIELNEKMELYRWLDAKERNKESKISHLENELLRKTKAAEQNQTILKMHIAHLESEIHKLQIHIKQLTEDVSKLDAKYLEKEQISLMLIKELKDELLASKYALSKK